MKDDCQLVQTKYNRNTSIQVVFEKALLSLPSDTQSSSIYVTIEQKIIS